MHTWYAFHCGSHTVEPWFLNLICSERLFKKQFVKKPNYSYSCVFPFITWETRDWSHRHLTQALEGKSCQVEERPGVLLDNQVSLSVNNRVGAELTVWEPRHSGTRVGLYVHTETRGYAGWSSLQKTLRPIRRALHPSAASLSKWLKASEHHPCITLITSHPGQNSTRFMVSEE